MTSQSDRTFVIHWLMVFITLSGHLLVAADESKETAELRAKAEAGEAVAQFKLGRLYQKGETVAKDLTEAAKWYRRAAEQGHAPAQFSLGLRYENGQGVEKNAVEAATWYRKAAEQGLASAQYNLGVSYENGEGVAKDAVEATKWYRKAAEQGNATAQNSLGWCYYNGVGVEHDAVMAEKWYRKAAEQGNVPAQNNLGLLYFEGKGVAKNYAEAFIWYLKAAEQGNTDAQYNLGVLYLNGTGVENDAGEAVKWYRRAAEAGDASAQNSLGMCYYNGVGVEHDAVMAEKWYRKAAEQGNAPAQNNLGLLYFEGKGVAKNYAEASKWYLKAAEQGLASAQSNLGVLYENGEGVPKDAVEAAKWYRKAAEQGNATAQYNLGVCYANGIGVPQDPSAAEGWYRKAAEQGNIAAKAQLETPTPSPRGLTPPENAAVDLWMAYFEAAKTEKLPAFFAERRFASPVGFVESLLPDTVIGLEIAVRFGATIQTSSDLSAAFTSVLESRPFLMTQETSQGTAQQQAMAAFRNEARIYLKRRCEYFARWNMHLQEFDAHNARVAQWQREQESLERERQELAVAIENHNADDQSEPARFREREVSLVDRINELSQQIAEQDQIRRENSQMTGNVNHDSAALGRASAAGIAIARLVADKRRWENARADNRSEYSIWLSRQQSTKRNLESRSAAVSAAYSRQGSMSEILNSETQRLNEQGMTLNSTADRLRVEVKSILENASNFGRQ